MELAESVKSKLDEPWKKSAIKLLLEKQEKFVRGDNFVSEKSEKIRQIFNKYLDNEGKEKLQKLLDKQVEFIRLEQSLDTETYIAQTQQVLN